MKDFNGGVICIGDILAYATVVGRSAYLESRYVHGVTDDYVLVAPSEEVPKDKRSYGKLYNTQYNTVIVGAVWR